MSSSTSAAIARPTISEEISPPCAFAISWPPSSTRTPSPLACSASSISVSPVVTGIAPGSSVSGMRMTPIVPSEETLGVGGRRRAAYALEPGSIGGEPVDALLHGGGLRAVGRLPDHVDGVRAVWGKRSEIRSAAARDSEPGVE